MNRNSTRRVRNRTRTVRNRAWNARHWARNVTNTTCRHRTSPFRSGNRDR